jgi:hypothetical protein
MSGNKAVHHALHEHEINHQAQQGVSLAQRVAIFTAILASLTAVMSYHDSTIQGRALFLKNEAVIKQGQASDLWAFYQAKSSKESVMQIASQLAPPSKDENFQQQLQRYANEKEQIRSQAEALEAQSQADNSLSQALTADHQEGKGIMLMQIAVSLASITVLTRQRWLFILASIAAMVGFTLSVISWLT